MTCDDYPSGDKLGPTDFSFRTRVWECSERSLLANPTSAAANGKCSLLPDWLHVYVSMGFLENPKTIAYEVEFETSMDIYSTIDHRLPGLVDINGDPAFISNVVPAGATQSPRDVWESGEPLPPGQQQPNSQVHHRSELGRVTLRVCSRISFGAANDLRHPHCHHEPLQEVLPVILH